MNFEGMSIDELINIRNHQKNLKNWKICDDIRAYLDEKLVFIFDTKWGQEVYFLCKNESNTKREQVENSIKQEIRAEKYFESWLYSIRKSAGII